MNCEFIKNLSYNLFSNNSNRNSNKNSNIIFPKFEFTIKKCNYCKEYHDMNFKFCKK
jgi:hypothetical protein